MDEQQIVTLVGQGGGWAALIVVIYKVGMALVEKTKELGGTIRDLITALSNVREDLAALNAKVDVLADVTPIRGTPKQRAATEPGARGFYAPRKPPREDG